MNLQFDGERCPDGVELFDYGPEKPLPKGPLIITGKLSRSGRHFRYRTARREPVRTDIANLEDPVGIQYVNARDDEARVKFLSRFGLPTAAEIDREELIRSQRSVRRLVESAGGADHTAGLLTVNNAIAQHKTFNLQPVIQLGANGAPEMILKPQTLLGLMLMEAAIILTTGARFTTCEKCGAAFLTGPLTWRRAHAVYCSDRCRVAAMRARQKQQKV